MVAMIMGWGISPEQGWRKGPWTPAEDKLLSEYVKLHGEGRWSSVSRCAGLNRSGKSCRLRWVNYLRPGLKRDQITPQEEGIIIELHALWGNKWSTIARYLPGRTDNLIKNYWRTHFKKREKSSQKQDKKRERQQQRVLEAGEMKRVSTNVIEAQAGKQEMMPAPPAAAFMYPSLEDQCLPVNVMSQDVAASWAADYSVVEDQDYGLWGGLWNLDDHPHPQNHNTNCNMIAMQNQAPTFSFVGDPI